MVDSLGSPPHPPPHTAAVPCPDLHVHVFLLVLHLSLAGDKHSPQSLIDWLGSYLICVFPGVFAFHLKFKCRGFSESGHDKTENDSLGNSNEDFKPETPDPTAKFSHVFSAVSWIHC